MKKKRDEGEFLKRSAERTFLGLLFQEPPRSERLVWPLLSAKHRTRKN
jgi:hypothetical protein